MLMTTAIARRKPNQLRPVQRIEIDFALCAPDVAFVAIYLRMPADIYDAADSALILNQHRSVIFDRVAMHGIRELPCYPQRLAKKEVQQVNAV